MPDPTTPRMGEEEWERELAQWEDHGCAGVCDFCADAANVLIAEAKRAREAEERLTRVIGDAPHDVLCVAEDASGAPTALPCDCWKKARVSPMSEILTREEYERTWARIREFLRQRGDYPAVGSSALAALDKGDAALRARVAKLERVIEWALGERGDFPSLPDDWPKRKFYWRTELRERAFGKSKAKVSG